MTLPPHDPYAQPSPAPQNSWGEPAPAAPEQMPVSGPAPGGDLGADLGAALSFAGNALLRNPVTYLVSGLIFCVIYLLIIGGGTVGGIFAMLAFMGDPYASGSDELAGLLAFYGIFFGALLLAMPFTLLWQSGAARAAEIVREGG
ncbi:MAG: hypothetical protein ACTH1T_17275, partial [Brachybacterium tyrofermentans]